MANTLAYYDQATNITIKTSNNLNLIKGASKELSITLEAKYRIFIVMLVSLCQMLFIMPSVIVPHNFAKVTDNAYICNSNLKIIRIRILFNQGGPAKSSV